MHLFTTPWRSYVEWPSQCQICHAWPSQTLCGACVQRFAQPTPRCVTCALPLRTDRCGQCAVNPSPLDACLAGVSYGFPWSDLIAHFKFKEASSLAKPLAQLMRHAPWVEPALERATSVIPMPIAVARLRERGFNQAVELARHLAPQRTRIDLLMRSGGNAHQVGASRQERHTRVRDVFWVNPRQLTSVRGQRIVLVDDVMTTGATLYAAARTLRRAGAAHITGMVLARAEPSTLT